MTINLKINCLIFNRTTKLNTISFYYSFSREKNYVTKYISDAHLPSKGILIRIISFVIQLIRSFYKSPLYLKKYYNKIIFLALTNNQYTAFEKIINKYSQDEIIIIKDYKSTKNNFPYFWAFLISLCFIPWLIKKYYLSDKRVRGTFAYALDMYLLGYGVYFISRLLFNFYGKPKAMVFSNDHTTLPRAFLKAAQDEGIKTIYLQHASVSKKIPFPPLEFDYALLEGHDALEKYDCVCLLQPTSPLRKVEDIDGCIENRIKNNADSCVSVTEVDQHPYWMYKIDENEILEPLFLDKIIYRRQDLPKIYALNGAVYIATVNQILEKKVFITKNTLGLKMNKKKSIDIDDEIDFRICNELIEELNV